MRDHGNEAAIAAAKAMPPTVVSIATTVGGLSLNDWVLVATLIYIVLQAGWLLLKAYWALRDRRERREREEHADEAVDE